MIAGWRRALLVGGAVCGRALAQDLPPAPPPPVAPPVEETPARPDPLSDIAIEGRDSAQNNALENEITPELDASISRGVRECRTEMTTSFSAPARIAGAIGVLKRNPPSQ